MLVAIQFEGQIIYRFNESVDMLVVMDFHKPFVSMVCILQRMLSCVQETNDTICCLQFY